MSTKIHDAFKFKKENISLAEIQAWSVSYRERIQQIANDKFVEFIAREYLSYWDAIALGHTNMFADEKERLSYEKNSVTSRIMDIAHNAQSEIEKAKASPFKTLSSDGVIQDASFFYDTDISIMPLGKSVGFICYLNPAYIKLFESDDSIMDYGYWNNSDAPENVSQKEWDQREEEWSVALSGYKNTPSESGFNLSLVNTSKLSWYEFQSNASLPATNLVVKWLTDNTEFVSIKSRARRIAARISTNAEYTPDRLKTTKSHYDIIEYLQSQEYKDLKNKIADEIALKLTPFSIG